MHYPLQTTWIISDTSIKALMRPSVTGAQYLNYKSHSLFVQDRKPDDSKFSLPVSF